MARSNEILLFIMCLVIGIFIWLGIRYVFHLQGWGGLLSYKPFYNPATFNLGAIMTATSFAALTYIGFDGVTTLAEDVRNPKRNMLLAPILVCLFTGLFSGLQIYLAQRIWPDYNTFPNPETAFFDVAALVGGRFLFNAMAVILFIACLGSGLAGQVGAARLLFGMGRDGVIPGKIFSHLDAKRGTPSYNIILMGVLTIIGSLLLSYQGAAELLNFGAFIAFMGVNIACFRQFFFLRPEGEKRRIVLDVLLSSAWVFSLFFYLDQSSDACQIIGGIWFGIGLLYLIIKTRGLSEKTGYS